MSATTISVTMSCADCGRLSWITVATPEHPFQRSRGRITLPRQITEHECPAALLPSATDSEEQR